VLSLSSCLKSRWIVQAKRRSKHGLNNIPLQDVAGGQDQVYSMQSVTLKDELSYLSTSEIGQNIKKNGRGKHMRQLSMYPLLPMLFPTKDTEYVTPGG